MTPATRQCLSAALLACADAFRALSVAMMESDEAAPAREPIQVDVAPEPVWAVPESVAAAIVDPAKPILPVDTRHKTPERVALLNELWFTPGVTRAEILTRLNALPGREIPAKQVGAYVIQWGISPSAAEPARMVGIKGARSPAPEPVVQTVEPERPPPPAPSGNGAVPRPTLADMARQGARELGIALRSPPPRLVTSDAARPAIQAMVSAAGTSVLASRDAIQSWGAQRGIITGKLDLDQVNARRRKLQLPPFEIETFPAPTGGYSMIGGTIRHG